MKSIANILLQAILLMLVAEIVPGVFISTFWGAIVAVLVMALLNTLVKPLLFILTLPVTIVTFGLFTFVLNAGMFLLASRFVAGFTVEGFGSALLGSLLYSLFTTLFSYLLK